MRNIARWGLFTVFCVLGLVFVAWSYQEAVLSVPLDDAGVRLAQVRIEYRLLLALHFFVDAAMCLLLVKPKQ